jgi:AcrR family transcriptional regulator
MRDLPSERRTLIGFLHVARCPTWHRPWATTSNPQRLTSKTQNKVTTFILTKFVIWANMPPMPINPRILRDEANDLDDFTPRFQTERQRALREHIIKVSQALLARHGRHNITFAALALALGLGTGTLRRHFIDLDALLGEILRRHLMDLSRHLGEIPLTDPDCESKRRAKYFEYTRTAFGGLTEAHLLFVRERHTLPEDILPALEQTREGIGQFLGPDPYEALSLLDTPYFTLARIEAIIAIQPTPALHEQPVPEPDFASEHAPATLGEEPDCPLPNPGPAHLLAALPAPHPIPPTTRPPPAPD